MPLRKQVDLEKVVGRIIKYVQYVLIILLVITVILSIAQTVSIYLDYDPVPRIAIIASAALCGIALVILESISMYLVKAFNIKMVFFAFECLIMVALGVLTGNALVVVLFCIVLTECYMNLKKQVDKFIMFICACAFYIVSYVIGWVMVNAGASVLDSIVIILSGCLYGLLAMLIDYIIVDFLMYLYQRNSELRRALKEAEESRAALKEAYSKLAETSVYEERNRIARDIHDNAGHSITAVIMQTEAAKLTIDTDPEQARRSIIAANMQARNALEQMRSSVHLLAGRGETLPLKSSIEQTIMETTDGMPDVKIRSDLDELDVSEAMYQYINNTVKECLANGLRHGGATAFYIEMKQEGPAVHLLISDNGSGVPGDIQEGFGLKGIRERAAQLGGKCAFTTDEDDGFETDILLPLPAAKSAASAPAQVSAPASAPASASASETPESPAASQPAKPTAIEKTYANTAEVTARAQANAAETSERARANAAEASERARANAAAASAKANAAAFEAASMSAKAAAEAAKEGPGAATAAAYTDSETTAAPAANETIDALYTASNEDSGDGSYAVSGGEEG